MHQQNSQNSREVTDFPISQEKINNCYMPNGENYPLCKGILGKKECKECNLFEDIV